MTAQTETAPGTVGRLRKSVRFEGLNDFNSKYPVPDFQAEIVTAIPVGPNAWRVKVAPHLDRLTCLGAAVLFANNIGGRAVA